MPTNITTFTNAKLDPFINPEQARVMDVKLTVSTTYARGTIVGEVTASPGTYKKYASGNVDGSQFARAILMYDVVTDASGNVTYSGTTSQSGADLGQSQLYTQAYYAGTFDTRELTGLDANAITAAATNGYFGRLIEGTVSAGILRLG